MRESALKQKTAGIQVPAVFLFMVPKIAIKTHQSGLDDSCSGFFQASDSATPTNKKTDEK